MTRVVKNEKVFLIILFLCAFFVRALVFYFHLSNNQNYWQVDSNTYHLISTEISKGNGISLPNGKPNFYRLPGYPIFLSLYYKLFGVDTKNVLWVQIFISSLIPILIFFLSLQLFPGRRRLAQFAASYSTIHLGLVLYSGFFMTETLFIILLLLFSLQFFPSFNLFFCKKHPENTCQEKDYVINNYKPIFLPEPACFGPDYIQLQEKILERKVAGKKRKNLKPICIDITLRQIFFAGFFLGLASLVRPVGHYLLIAAVTLLFFSRNKFSKKLEKSFLLFLGWIIPTSFWLIRNYMLLGALFFHTLPGGHFLYLSAARVAMHVHNTSYEKARKILGKEVQKLTQKQQREKKQKLNEIEMCKAHEKIAIKYFKMNPLLTIKNWLTDMFRTSFSLYSSELLFLDSGKKSVNFFEKDRPIFSMFKRYLFPPTNSFSLKIIIYTEILFFIFILLGMLFAFAKSIKNFHINTKTSMLFTWLKILPIMGLFIVIALSGGYSRMRLPIEPFMIILSMSFWVTFFEKIKLFKKTN